MARFPHFARRTVPFWLPLLLLACKAVPNLPPDELLTGGKQLREEKKYARASEYFYAIKRRHPESLEDEEASYLLADTKRLERYGGSSFKAYEDFATRYPNSRFSVAAAEGEYRLGQAYFERDLWGILFFKPDPAVGARVMEHMQVNYRNHELADDALLMAGDYFAGKRKWEDGLVFYRRLLQEYPRSRHVLRARFQLARSQWEMSEGADYDERLLYDARRGFHDFVASVRVEGKQEELAPQIESAESAIAAIDERMAKKLYRIGRFYERTKHPGSALWYYNHCLTRYPDSESAKDCARRAEVLRNRGVVERPAEPAPPDGEKGTA